MMLIVSQLFLPFDDQTQEFAWMDLNSTLVLWTLIQTQKFLLQLIEMDPMVNQLNFLNQVTSFI
jgi:hypothetical protein